MPLRRWTHCHSTFIITLTFYLLPSEFSWFGYLEGLG
jgi:hypothetical protein